MKITIQSKTAEKNAFDEVRTLLEKTQKCTDELTKHADLIRSDKIKLTSDMKAAYDEICKCEDLVAKYTSDIQIKLKTIQVINENLAMVIQAKLRDMYQSRAKSEECK